MKKQSVLFLIVLTLLAMLLMTACGTPPATSQAEPTAPPSSGSETGTEEPAAEEPATTETVGEETSSGGPTLDENGVPTDVPLMAEMYDLRVEAESTRIIYKVVGTVEDVVTFYQTELPLLGWDKVLGADSAIGAMGAMGRQNAQSDKLSVSLSFNPNGNFVTVIIDIHRGP